MAGRGVAGGPGRGAPARQNGDVYSPPVPGVDDCSVDQITVVRSLGGVLTKKFAIGPNGWVVMPFSAGAWFSIHQRSVASLDELAALLDRVALDPRASAVRGRLLLGIDRGRACRLCDRAQHGRDRGR